MSTPFTPLPPLFKGRMQKWLGAAYDDFIQALNAAPQRGLRLNPLKISAEDFLRRVPFPVRETVPWCPDAYYLGADIPAGKHPWHLAGLYYLQDPSAMMPGVLLEPHPGERILDLTAAPGGKTTHIAAQMQGRGLLVANEIKRKRIGHLAQNVERWGTGNIVITNETPERLADHFGAYFDRVIVDAPCSGEGMFRKDMGARRDWSPEMVQGCALRQGKILRVAAHLVRPGGVLLYSTCTFAPEENEGTLAAFLREHPDFSVETLPSHPQFDRGHPEWLPGNAPESLRNAVRLWPHKIAGDGHFIARLRRREDTPARPRVREGQPPRIHARLLADWHTFHAAALEESFPQERLFLRKERLYLTPEILPDLRGLRVLHPGVWLGTFKKNRFEPAHPLALYLKEGKNMLQLQADDPQLGTYLRGEVLQRSAPPGWTLVCVDGYPLGWGKQVGDKLKNHYPRGWLQKNA